MRYLPNSWPRAGRAALPLLAACCMAWAIDPPKASACWDFDSDDYRIALLNPYVAGADYASFFYASDYLNGYENAKGGADRRRNGEEWAAKLGNGLTYTDVLAGMYRTSLDGVLNAVSERHSDNAFLKALLLPRHKALLDYFVWAKRYEHASKQHYDDPWADPWHREWVVTGTQELKLEAEAAMAATTDPWLRRRYAYQLLLMGRYAADSSTFHRLFDTHFKGDRSTVLSDWALHHKAALTANPAEAAYLYGLSFTRCPEKNVAAYLAFDKNMLPQAMAFAQDDHERASLLLLAEVKNPGRSLEALRRIAALDPAHPLLPLLLVREANKLENWLFTERLTGLEPSPYPQTAENPWDMPEEERAAYRHKNRLSDERYLAEVRAFCEQLAREGRNAPSFVNLLAAHFLNMERSPKAAQYLAKVDARGHDVLRLQKTSEELISLLNTKDISTPATQRALATLLATLESQYATQPNGRRDFAALNALLREAYAKKGDLLTAYHFNNRSLPLSSRGFGTAYYAPLNFLDWRADEALIDRVLALEGKPNKSAFETYLTAGPRPSRNALRDLQGTIAFRKNDLPAAYAAFSQVDTAFWRERYEFAPNLLSDPFSIWRDTLRRGRFPDTKADFVKRLMDLEAEAVAHPAKAAECYTAIGTAWLNCTYHGKSWMMFCYGHSVSDGPEAVGYNTYLPPTKAMQGVYFDATRALFYFQKARLAAKGNREQLAHIDYLVARQAALSALGAHRDSDALYEMPWQAREKYLFDVEMSHFSKWAATYKGTGAWGDVTTACPSIAAYFGK